MWTAKIQRAKDHHNELNNRLLKFFETRPYSIDTKVDLKTKRLIYYVQNVKDTPDEIALLAGDVVQNLRSALDQLAYQLFVNNSTSSRSARHIYFPIAKDLASYNTKKQRDTRGISNSAKLLIDQARPYKGGNNELWQIHELNLIDKHRTLITAGSVFQSLDIGANMSTYMKESFPDKNIPTISFFMRPKDTQFPLSVGEELFSDLPGAKPNPEMQFEFNIVLNELGIVEGKPIIESLQSMIQAVEALEPIFRSELE